MLISSLNSRTVEDIGQVIFYRCNHCHKETMWELKKVTGWFSLFFIPIIPYEFDYYFMCPQCNYGYKLTKSDFKRIEVFYRRQYQQKHLFDINSSNKTETQLNYLKEIKKYKKA